LSGGTVSRVIRRKSADVSEEHVASIFRVEEKRTRNKMSLGKMGREELRKVEL
jgi:hypothetical protein